MDCLRTLPWDTRESTLTGFCQPNVNYLGRAPTAEPSPGYKTTVSVATRLAPVHEVPARWPPGRLLDDDDVTRLFELDPRFGKTSR